MKALNNYVNESEGYPVNLENFRKRLGGYLKYLVEQKKGTTPFKYGIFKDYWHSIPPNQIAKFDKGKQFMDQSLEVNATINTVQGSLELWTMN